MHVVPIKQIVRRDPWSTYPNTIICAVSIYYMRLYNCLTTPPRWIPRQACSTNPELSSHSQLYHCHVTHLNLPAPYSTHPFSTNAQASKFLKWLNPLHAGRDTLIIEYICAARVLDFLPIWSIWMNTSSFCNWILHHSRRTMPVHRLTVWFVVLYNNNNNPPGGGRRGTGGYS